MNRTMTHNKIHAIRQARAWLTERSLFLASETTGLNDFDEIVELALIDHDGTVLINTLIRPTIPIDPNKAIHGISNEDVIDAPGFSEIMPNLINLTQNHLVIIYNADFSQRILRQSARVCKVKRPAVFCEVQCAMKIYTQFHGSRDGHHDDYYQQSQAKAAKQLGYEIPTDLHQAKAAKQLGLEIPPDLHRAAADAQLCRAIVEAIAATPLPEDENNG